MANSNMMHRTQAASCFHLKNTSSVSFKIIIVFISQYQFPAVLLPVFPREELFLTSERSLRHLRSRELHMVRLKHIKYINIKT